MFHRYSKLAYLVFALIGHGLLAKVIYVDDNATAGGDGSSWSTAHKYLQDGLAIAEYGDEIWVAEGTYKPDQGAGKTAGDRASPFVLVNGVGMYGGFLGTESIRDPQGDNNQTILSGEIDSNSSLWSLNVVSGANLDANTTLDGFRITKGNANGASGTVYENGGGIYLKDSNLICSNCVFMNNYSATAGGGIYSNAESYLLNYFITLNDCVFTNNSAGLIGGGIYAGSDYYTAKYVIKLVNCVFNNNSAGSSGGSIYAADSSSVQAFDSLILSNCTFTNNASYNGGAIYSGATSSTLTNCVFENNSASRNGGGIFAKKPYNRTADIFRLNLTNCVFTNNSAGEGSRYGGEGGGIYASYELTLTNCVFTNNSASNHGGGIYASYESTLTNCILWTNTTGSKEEHGLNSESFKSFVLQESVEAEYPGDTNARDAVYEPNLNILQGWEGDARAFDADPLFADIDNPIGPDGIWFTEDDGLRVISVSPAIDAGYNDSLPTDSSDLDMDGNTTESIPYDALGRTRRVGTKVDIGAYEFDPANPPPIVKKALSLTAGTGGTAVGEGYFEVGTETIISATPSAGYLFSNWNGDASGSTNPLTITIDADKSITANFIQDLNDDDEDGLTNFSELVTHGTDPNKQDTDNDGISDDKEINLGTNPKESDHLIVNFLLDPQNRNGIVEDAASSALKKEKSEDFNLHFETPISVSTISASGSKNIGSFSAELSITKGGNSRILLQFFVKSATSSNYNKYIGTDSILLGSANLNAMKYNVRAEDLSPDTYYIARAIIRDDYSRIHAVGQPILFKTDPVPSYSESEVSSAKDEGIATVTNDPASYSLVSKSAYDQALLDANESAEQAIADARVSAKAEGVEEGKLIGLNEGNVIGRSEGEQSVTSNPSAYNLVTKSAYDQMVDDMIKKQSANATHYTEGWFYLPNRGWIWTNHSSYPYFYDAEDKDWMYFQSGEEKPRFYRYKTKTWLTIE